MKKKIGSVLLALCVFVAVFSFCTFCGFAAYEDKNGGQSFSAFAERIVVSYNANGGTGAPDFQEKEAGTPLRLSAVVPKRDGYSFLGWTTESESTIVYFYPGSFYTADRSAVLYAVWKKTDHVHSYVDEVVEPTCTERGYTKHTCTVCGNIEIDMMIRENGHDVKLEKEVSATCTQSGRTAGAYCKVCKKVLKGLEIIEPLGHETVSDKNGVSPTCTESGKTPSEHCKRCGYVVAQKSIPPLGHKIVKDAAKAPTCTRQGKTEGEHCLRCDYKSGQETIPATGHYLITDSAVKATCTEPGLSSGKHCTRCDYRVAQNVISPLGHNIIKEEEKKATCTTAGLTLGEYCTRCNYKWGKNVIPALGHKLEKDSGEKPTCTKNGTSSGEHCVRCSYKSEREIVPALGHYIVNDEAVKATCAESGLTAGKHCTRCNYRTVQNKVAPLGHNIVTDKAKEATCTEAGLSKGEHCTRCDYKVLQKSTPALGHYFVKDPAVNATCTKSGLTAGKHCTRCNYRTVQNKIAPLGHNIVTDKAKEATCEKTGLSKGKHCTRCDYKVLQKSTPKKAHTFEKKIQKATVSKDGAIREKCRVCGALGKNISLIPKISSAVLSKTKTVYNGKAQMPGYIVKDRTGKLLRIGTDYTVLYSDNKTVGKAFAKITFKGNYGGTKTLSFRILPPAVKNISVFQTANRITVKWSGSFGANGYKVFLYKDKKCVKTVDTTENFASFEKLKPGADYKITVKAYVMIGKAKAISSAQKSVFAATKPQKPNFAVKTKNGSAVLSWNDVEGAESYTVFFSQSKNSGFKKITVKKNYCKIKNLKRGSVYCFKVCANKKSGSKVLSSAFAAKKIKIK